MKRNVAGVYSYTFTPNTNSINLSGIPSFNISNLFAIIDLTTGAPIYAAGLQGMSYTSLSGTTLILSAQMGEAEANDSLMIIYDDGYEASAAGTVGLVFPIASVNTQVSASHPLPVSVSSQTAGLAQDSSVQSVVTSLGADGSPPSFPGSSSGVFGYLHWLGNLLTGGTAKLTLPGAVAPTASFTRPSNTSAYSSGQLVANSTSSGAVSPMILACGRATGVGGKLYRAVLQKSSVSITNAVFSVHLFTVSPTVANGDGGTWSPNQSANYIGHFDVTMDRALSDGATGSAGPSAGNAVPFVPASGSVDLYALLEARGAYTPASAETFQLTLELMQS